MNISFTADEVRYLQEATTKDRKGKGIKGSLCRAVRKKLARALAKSKAGE